LGKLRGGRYLLNKGGAKDFVLPEALLPANFVLYAHCVEEIRKATASAYGHSRYVQLAIRTLLTKSITHWYNIQRFHLADEKAFWCSALWWEDYKARIRTGKLTHEGIRLHRLLRYGGAGSEDLEKQKSYLRLRFRFNRQRDYLIPQEFVDVKDQLHYAFGDSLAWAMGLENIGPGEATKLPEIPIQPICFLRDQSARAGVLAWENDRYQFIPAFEDFSSYHCTVGYADTPTAPKGAEGEGGAWCKLVEQSAIDGKGSVLLTYDDLFLVDFQIILERNITHRFGISLRIEEHKDLAGIELLSFEEVDAAVGEFDAAWKKATKL